MHIFVEAERSERFEKIFAAATVQAWVVLAALYWIGPSLLADMWVTGAIIATWRTCARRQSGVPALLAGGAMAFGVSKDTPAGFALAVAATVVWAFSVADAFSRGLVPPPEEIE